MIIVVTGGRPRTMASPRHICEALDNFHAATPITVLINGWADGTDRTCDAWAVHNGVQVARCPALWDYYDRDIAGSRRNRLMLTLQPNICLQFAGGKGTANMAKQAKEAGIEVRVL